MTIFKKTKKPKKKYQKKKGEKKISSPETGGSVTTLWVQADY